MSNQIGAPALDLQLEAGEWNDEAPEPYRVKRLAPRHEAALRACQELLKSAHKILRTLTDDLADSEAWVPARRR